MRSGFVRDSDGGITWYCLPFEVGLLESMATQLVELVDAPDWSDDPLERWANERDAPPLDRLPARMLPPCASTMARQIARPSPPPERSRPPEYDAYSSKIVSIRRSTQAAGFSAIS